MNKETPIELSNNPTEALEQILKEDDSAVFVINEKNPMAGFMELVIKNQLWMSGYNVEEINEAYENGNIESDGFDFKIIKGKENK